MVSITDKPITPEIVLALLKETTVEVKEMFAEVREMFTEVKERQAKTAQQIEETGRQIEETGRQMKETDRQVEKTVREVAEVSKTLGSWANNQGSFAEEYFFNSFYNGKQNFFGEKFDEIEKGVKGFKKDFRDEYDILFTNGKSVGIIEVKYKAHEKDINKILRKAETFRINFPDYAGHKIYLGLASMSFYDELEEECIAKGIAVIKQVGDTVVINDKNLKAF